jgi:protein KTI12
MTAAVLGWIEVISARCFVAITTMPCIIMTGHPGAGKSTLAEKIRTIALEHHGDSIAHTVIIVDDDTVCPGIPMDASYGTSLAEKKTRGALKAAFDRVVASHPSALIILDSLNYIKGFRYELFCISKAASQKHCVLWVLNETPPECNKTGGRYGKELYDALKMRYEPPDERNRWDRPLYRIDVHPQHARTTATAAGDALHQSVYNMHNLSAVLGSKPNQSQEDNTSATTHTSAEQASTPQRVVSAASTFKKRAVFKRPDGVTTRRDNANSVAPLSLTVEALSAFNKGQETPPTTTGPVESLSPGNTSDSIALPTTEQTGPATIEKQIEEMLRSFLQDVQPLKQGTSTKQNVASDADLLHTIDLVTRATVEGSDTSLQRAYMSWIATHPPSDVSQKGIEASFQAFASASKR